MGLPERADFEGEKKAITQYDEKAELYAQECAALEELIKKHGWPKGWPKERQLIRRDIFEGVVFKRKDDLYVTFGNTRASLQRWQAMGLLQYPLPCGETILMLMGMVDLHYLEMWDRGKEYRDTRFLVRQRIPAILCDCKDDRIADLGTGQTLILALCVAVRAKLMMEAKHD